jgi:hypothetical protein
MIYGLLIKTKFQVSKPLTLFNRIVRLRLPYDHAAIMFEENGMLIVAEMKVFGGYTETPYDEWIKQYDREIVMEPMDCTIEDVRAHKGKKYDRASTFWALPVYILTGKWIGRKAIADRKLFCFEYYAILKKQPEFWLYMPGFEKK